MSPQAWGWIGFNVFVLLMLALDLGVFHRKAHVVKWKEAVLWSVVWIALALVFSVGVFHYRGSEAGLQFLTGYLIEKSLSVDNIFVFLIVFSYFNVPALYQHKVLFWGVLGALIMRAALIFAGAALITRFHWMIYLFGGFLILTAVKMVLTKDRKFEPEKNPVLRLVRRLLPVTENYEGDKLLVRRGGRTWATPLFIVLVVIEMTDLIFAVDSIPAILAITSDTFIVYTSNVFAILGLRSLYFALAGLMHRFHLLSYGLAAVLAFVGAKMMLSDVYKVPVTISLGVIAVMLAVTVAASLMIPPKEKHASAAG